MQNGVSSNVYEGEILSKNRNEMRERGGGKKGEMRKKKRRKDSLYLGRSGLSHLKGDFLMF